MEKCCCGKGLHAMCIGALLFIIGILRLYNFSWPKVLMIIGALAFVKGVYLYYKCK